MKKHLIKWISWRWTKLSLKCKLTFQVGSFNKYLIVLKISMAPLPIVSLPLCLWWNFYTCLLPSCVNNFKGCFINQNEGLSLKYFRLAHFLSIMEFDERLCMGWFLSSGIVEFQRAPLRIRPQILFCLLILLWKHGLGVKGKVRKVSAEVQDSSEVWSLNSLLLYVSLRRAPLFRVRKSCPQMLIHFTSLISAYTERNRIPGVFNSFHPKGFLAFVKGAQLRLGH